MKISIATLVLSVAVVSMTSPAHASHGRFRHYDDVVFAAYSNARNLRWEIHDDFTGSRDYQHLLSDVDAIMDEIRTLQRQIYQERPARVLDQTLDSVLSKIHILRDHLNNSDFAARSRGVHQITNRGYTFQPATIHPGRVHVDAALKMLSEMEAPLIHMHNELAASNPPRRGHSGGRTGGTSYRPGSGPAMTFPHHGR